METVTPASGSQDPASSVASSSDDSVRGRKSKKDRRAKQKEKREEEKRKGEGTKEKEKDKRWMIKKEEC